ncbi:MAG: nucleotide exchange factor GrpE [Actinomycetota bacterium]
MTEDRPKIKITDRRRGRADGGSAGDAELDEAIEQEEKAAEEVESDLDRLGREASEYREMLQRLQAEFENYRKRVLKEQTLAIELASEPLVRSLLEVLDEFELALIAAGRQPDFEQFLRGVELVFAKLSDTLRSAGVERMDPEGTPFDPEQHEALMQEGDGDGEPIVADVLRPGYTMRGRVIRPAGVKVKKD